MLFKKKEPKVVKVGDKEIALQPKPSKFWPSKKPKPAQAPFVQRQPSILPPAAPKTPDIPKPPLQQRPVPQQPVAPPTRAQRPGQHQKQSAPNPWKRYIQSVMIKNKDLDAALREHHIAESAYEFVQRMLIASVIIALVVTVTFFLVLSRLKLPIAGVVVLSLAFGIAANRFTFINFLKYPIKKGASESKDIEREILFAARDIIISLRSGMPLYNAIVAVSTGYGRASREFAKITERTQLGMPMEEAIDLTISESKSYSFRRIMLQASTSIKAGADVISALQSITDQLSQERVIAMRKYGQRLNAVAMFYMLFGVILPSIGIAIATILTTFISVFVVTPTVLEAAILGIVFLQLFFLQLVRTSRPTFAL